MKKALLSLLMVAVFLPFAGAQDNVQRAIITNSVSHCSANGPYTWAVNGESYTTDTVVSFLSVTGDTVYLLDLTINNPSVNNETITSTRCNYTWRGTTYQVSGLYSDTIHAAATSGLCDSIFNVNLTIPTSEVDNFTMRACGSYEWHDSTYTATGVYTDTTYMPTTSTTACTHIDVLNLSIVSTLNVVEDVENCGRYNWHDSVYAVTGSYSYVATDTAVGCDTVHTLNLTITVDTASTMERDSVCASKTWHGVEYTQTGIYSTLDTNRTTGCVTYRTIDLKVKTPRQGLLDSTLADCNGLQFKVGTITKKFAEDAIFDTVLHYVQWSKCIDSTIHLNVTIHKSGYDTTYAATCDSFYWNYDKLTYYSTPATAPSVHFGKDTFGCDSIMVLMLNIHKSPVITAINGEWNLEAGQTAVLYPSCTAGSSYKWTYGNQTSTADTLRIENVQGNFDVALEATLNYPENSVVCHDTSWITIVTFVGINGVENTNVSLYPNPAVGQLNIECGEAIREVVIFNTLGQQVLVNSNLGNKSLLNLANLAKGTYTMRIALENGETIIRKFVLTK